MNSQSKICVISHEEHEPEGIEEHESEDIEEHESEDIKNIC